MTCSHGVCRERGGKVTFQWRNLTGIPLAPWCRPTIGGDWAVSLVHVLAISDREGHFPGVGFLPETSAPVC